MGLWWNCTELYVQARGPEKFYSCRLRGATRDDQRSALPLCFEARECLRLRDRLLPYHKRIDLFGSELLCGRTWFRRPNLETCGVNRDRKTAVHLGGARGFVCLRNKFLCREGKLNRTVRGVDVGPKSSLA